MVLLESTSLCADLFDFSEDVVGVTMQTASRVTVVIEAVLAPAAAINPAQDFIHVLL